MGHCCRTASIDALLISWWITNIAILIERLNWGYLALCDEVCTCFSCIRKEVASKRRDLCSPKGWRPVFGDDGALENASSPDGEPLARPTCTYWQPTCISLFQTSSRPFIASSLILHLMIFILWYSNSGAGLQISEGSMTMDCSEVPTNVTYDCAHPWGDGCTSKKGFDFTSLWQYTLRIQGACPTNPRLFLTEGKDATASNCALTQSACAHIAREKWTEYPKVNIWTRMTTWKFPLLQLMFLFPRPPLNNWV